MAETKPLVFGRCRNVQPVNYDPDSCIYVQYPDTIIRARVNSGFAVTYDSGTLDAATGMIVFRPKEPPNS